uniref:Polynucleotide 5'-hydroxyl-kinase NOL9 n=1 Tax=Anas platyrhynchos TaxID=8839 RepID=A0A8B9T0I1_ANAPL
QQHRRHRDRNRGGVGGSGTGTGRRLLKARGGARLSREGRRRRPGASSPPPSCAPGWCRRPIPAWPPWRRRREPPCCSWLLNRWAAPGGDGTDPLPVLLPHAVSPPQALTFTGKCRLRCLYGAVRVLGFAIGPHQPGLPVFSPPTHCALALEALPAARPPAADPRQFSPECAVVLLEHLDTPVTRFLLSLPPLSRLFEAQVSPRRAPHRHPSRWDWVAPPLLLLHQNEHPVEQEEPAYEGVPVIMVCGPKSIGKSTFNRYLINLLLNHLPSVEYMECDIGQTEFTPPGCVSLSSVTEPFLGPPFTHQQTPRKMVYYGQTSCEQDTERYIDKEVPLVINTMGWVKGKHAPTHVVQMDVYDWKAMDPLTPEYVHLAPGLYTKGKQQGKSKQTNLSAAESWKSSEGEEDTSVPDYKLLYIHPERVHSSILRDMSILGYLGHLQPPHMDQYFRCIVPFNAVALRVIHTDVAPTNIMYAVNASWVGLCRIPDEIRCQNDGPVLLTQTPVCDCLGFGIVRGVEMEKKLYHVLTPVPPENLRQVNCLLLGNIAIPNCVLVSQEGIEGEIPYVTSEYNYNILGSGKLKQKKHFKKREYSYQCDYT